VSGRVTTLRDVTDDDGDLAPLHLFEYADDPGTFCLMLSDAPMEDTADVFRECDRWGNGYGWEAVARSAVRDRAPDLAELIDYESEASTFVAYGTDRPALHRLGVLLRDAVGDHAVLAGLIRAAEPSWFE
jgi:hypothetical protein